MKSRLLCVITVAAITLLGGCDFNIGPQIPEGPSGFALITQYLSSPSSAVLRAPYVNIKGQLDYSTSDLSHSQGSLDTFNVTTSAQGNLNVFNVIIPADWIVTWLGVDTNKYPDWAFLNHCNNLAGEGVINPGGIVVFTCPLFSGAVQIGNGLSFTPEPLYTPTAPSVGTISGGGFTSTYGMPLAQYYGKDGTLAAQENASYISPNGSSIQIPGGNLSQLPPGSYVGFVNNATSGGGWSYVGTVSTEIVSPVPVYRYYNGSDHFLDTSATTPAGYWLEETAFYIFSGQIADSWPFYRLFNPSLNKHMYTDNYNEMRNLATNYGWNYEGITGYVGNNQLNGTVPLYRTNNPSTGDHLFTTSWSEVTNATTNLGYVYEGMAGYVPTI